MSLSRKAKCSYEQGNGGKDPESTTLPLGIYWNILVSLSGRKKKINIVRTGACTYRPDPIARKNWDTPQISGGEN